MSRTEQQAQGHRRRWSLPTEAVRVRVRNDDHEDPDAPVQDPHRELHPGTYDPVPGDEAATGTTLPARPVRVQCAGAVHAAGTVRARQAQGGPGQGPGSRRGRSAAGEHSAATSARGRAVHVRVRHRQAGRLPGLHHGR
uniref:(northern house mosquito) hypothetical protein n=1 Tax=Culex pipiens TaxID=7175 RepID=A0A8D8C675_CULPI